jgi:DTW domain-containing protein YfiP
MNTPTPPFDPPYVGIHPTPDGAIYVETLADGTTRPASTERAARLQSTMTALAAMPQTATLVTKPDSKRQGQEKVFLKVPFAEKDEAKALGARWDAAKKKWYVPAGTDAGPFSRWSSDA